MPAIEIVCLAISKKYSSRCIAGIRTDGKGWIRPVGSGEHGGLSTQQCMVASGGPVQVLDTVTADFVAPQPAPHQPENWLAAEQPWKLVARPAGMEAARLLRAHLHTRPELFGDAADRIRMEYLQERNAPASLALVLPASLEWHVTPTRKKRVAFKLGPHAYDLPVTDVAWERRLEALAPGHHPKEAAGVAADAKLLLTVSLGDPYGEDGVCYKLVAAIIPVPDAWKSEF
jgi:hypothetical protein